MKIIRQNDNLWNLALILAVGVLAVFTFALRAQTTTAPVQAGTFTLTAANVSSLESLSDGQLKALLQALSATPLIWPDALPDGGMGGTYHSLAHPDWPPLPAAFGIPAWNLAAGSGSSFYLLDDLDYPEPTNTDSVMPTMDVSGLQAQAFTANDLWLQINSVTNNSVGWTVVGSFEIRLHLFSFPFLFVSHD